MLEKTLMWVYILGGLATFWYWISSILNFFRMAYHHKPECNWFVAATTGFFNQRCLTQTGMSHRNDLRRSITRFLIVIAIMYCVVFIGIQTQH